MFDPPAAILTQADFLPPQTRVVENLFECSGRQFAVRFEIGEHQPWVLVSERQDGQEIDPGAMEAINTGLSRFRSLFQIEPRCITSGGRAYFLRGYLADTSSNRDISIHDNENGAAMVVKIDPEGVVVDGPE